MSPEPDTEGWKTNGRESRAVPRICKNPLHARSHTKCFSKLKRSNRNERLSERRAFLDMCVLVKGSLFIYLLLDIKMMTGNFVRMLLFKDKMPAELQLINQLHDVTCWIFISCGTRLKSFTSETCFTRLHSLFGLLKQKGFKRIMWGCNLNPCWNIHSTVF